MRRFHEIQTVKPGDDGNKALYRTQPGLERDEDRLNRFSFVLRGLDGKQDVK
jgi:hypothetical protein